MKIIIYALLVVFAFTSFYSCTPQSIDDTIDKQGNSHPNERRKASEPTSGEG